MNRLIKDAKKTPFSHIIIITLFSVGLISIPLEKLFALFMENQTTAMLLGGTIMRVIVSLLAVIFIIKYNFKNQFFSLSSKKSLLILIPAMLVAINNAPIIGLITGNVSVNENSINVILYVLYCISIGFAEEFAFRGLIFPLCLKMTENLKRSAFFAVALNATVFALSHIVNIFNGYSVGAVIMQVGYTFLIGALCAIVFAITKNIFTAVIIHVVYDVGGLMCGLIAKGNQWDIITIIITAVLGVLVCVYMIFKVWHLDGKELKQQYFQEEIESEKEQ